MRTTIIILWCGAMLAASFSWAETKPNVILVLADQWRAQATGYAGDPNLEGKTPVLDQLASTGINFKNAVSCTPVCTPYRGILLTGQYPLKHGLFVNDVPLDPDALTMAKIFKQAGYDTAAIGKWHVDGYGREVYIPEERHQGFDYWKVLECTHSYNRSLYYEQNDPTQKIWDGYDAFAQTKDAEAYIAARNKDDKPFLLYLAWGPPHNPYEAAPDEYKRMFNPNDLILRPNVDATQPDSAVRRDLAGYYAHCVALDDALGRLLKTLEEKGMADDTIVLFTSDHGDMLGSHKQIRKQRPWDESIRVPFLVRYPAKIEGGQTFSMPINTPDILPTLLGLSGVSVPKSIDGTDYSAVILGEKPEPTDHAALIACYAPFGEWTRPGGGREYRGVRTPRYTYVRTLQDGPWLLFDNESDPYQQNNLVNTAQNKEIQAKLETQLQTLLKKTDDAFEPGLNLITKWGFPYEDSGARRGNLREYRIDPPRSPAETNTEKIE